MEVRDTNKIAALVISPNGMAHRPANSDPWYLRPAACRSVGDSRVELFDAFTPDNDPHQERFRIVRSCRSAIFKIDTTSDAHPAADPATYARPCGSDSYARR
jgi:hypothetical protein